MCVCISGETDTHLSVEYLQRAGSAGHPGRGWEDHFCLHAFTISEGAALCKADGSRRWWGGLSIRGSSQREDT